jgi:hypothetical protein
MIRTDVASLVPAGGDPPVARCKLCGKTAVGPCARCHSPVCGDCCELTVGGATTFAVCSTCAARAGTTLAPAWLGLLGWLGLIMAGLVGLGFLFAMLRHH